MKKSYGRLLEVKADKEGRQIHLYCAGKRVYAIITNGYIGRFERENNVKRVKNNFFSAAILVMIGIVILFVSEASAAETSVKEAGWFPHPVPTQLFWVPTGRLLNEKEINFSFPYVILPGIAVGITNNFSLGAGITLSPMPRGGSQLFHISPKIGLIKKESFNLAVGATTIGSTASSRLRLSVVYGVATFGSPDLSATIGLAVPVGTLSSALMSIVQLGGEIRILPWLSLVTENYFFDVNIFDVKIATPISLLGVRLLYERGSVDIAMLSSDGFSTKSTYFGGNFKFDLSAFGIFK